MRLEIKQADLQHEAKFNYLTSPRESLINSKETQGTINNIKKKKKKDMTKIFKLHSFEVLLCIVIFICMEYICLADFDNL